MNRSQKVLQKARTWVLLGNYKRTLQDDGLTRKNAVNEVVTHHAMTVPCNWNCHSRSKLYLDQNAEIPRWGTFICWIQKFNFAKLAHTKQFRQGHRGSTKKTEAFTGAIAYDRFVDGKVLTQTHKCTLSIFKFTRFYSLRSKSKRRKSTEEKKKKWTFNYVSNLSPKRTIQSHYISTESAGSTNGFPSLFTDLKGHPVLVLNTGHLPCSFSKPLDAEWRTLNISINDFWWSGVNAGILDIISNMSLMFFASLKGHLFFWNSGHFMNSFMMGASANLVRGYGQPFLNAEQWSLMETFAKAPCRK